MRTVRKRPFDVRAIRARIAGPPADPADTGIVISVGDGVARVSGLRDAMAGEMLEFADGLFGMALNLDEESIGVVLLGTGNVSGRMIVSGERGPRHVGAGRRPSPL
jgi:F0F1-type ATP synthase alpha subunit